MKQQLNPPSPEFLQLIAHLWRGGAYGFWAYESEARKPDDSKKAAERRSLWFPADQPKPLPPESGPQGKRHFWFGVHPSTQIPSTNRAGEAREPAYVRSQVEHIAAINALYSEYDAKDFEDGKAGALAHIQGLPKSPSVVIDSGGGYHCYWLLAETFVLSDEATRQRARAIQHAWVHTVGGDSDAKNLNRVLRVPGTCNYKSKYAPNYPAVAFVSADFERLYTLDELVAIVPAAEIERAKNTRQSPTAAADIGDVARAALCLDMLNVSRRDDYADWLDVGMALSELGQQGLALWEAFSRGSTKYKEGGCAEKWPTFVPGNGRTLASLAFWAKQDNPARFAESFQKPNAQTGGGYIAGHYTNTGGKGEAVDTETGEIITQEQETATDILLRIGSRATFYRTPGGEIYARAAVNSHEEVWAVGERGNGLRSWLIYEFHRETGKAPNSNALTSAIQTMQARALFEGEKREVFTRIGHHDGVVYLDLADERWRVVRITREGWEITTKCPILFRRPRGMLPLQAPARGGSLEGLRQLLNLGTQGEEDSDRRFILIVGWLLGCLSPFGPYAHLNLHGEGGTAKSTATRTLRALIDPNEASARAMPKEPRDIYIAAKNGHIVSYDNLSHLPDWFSDELCRLATGQASAARALYTDDDEVIFNAKRPCIFNGIGELVTRGDLLDRLISVDLPVITNRLTEKKHREMFEELAPIILGALCDGVVSALRNVDKIQLDNLPRLADFALWVESAGCGFGWEQGAFLQHFTENQDLSIDAEIEASPVAGALITLFQERRGGLAFSATPGELLEDLTDIVAPQNANGERNTPKLWPGNARALSSALQRVAPTLRRRRGIDVQFKKANGVRAWVVRAAGTQAGTQNSATGTQNGPQGRKINAFASLPSGDFVSENGATGTQNGKRDAKFPLQSPQGQKSSSRHNNEGVGSKDNGRDFASLASLNGREVGEV